MVLGIGAVLSTQYAKAIQRLETVVNKQPVNMEAITWLAEAYEANVSSGIQSVHSIYLHTSSNRFYRLDQGRWDWIGYQRGVYSSQQYSTPCQTINGEPSQR